MKENNTEDLDTAELLYTLILKIIENIDPSEKDSLHVFSCILVKLSHNFGVKKPHMLSIISQMYESYDRIYEK